MTSLARSSNSPMTMEFFLVGSVDGGAAMLVIVTLHINFISAALCCRE